MEKYILVLIEDIHRYFVSARLPQLTVMLNFPFLDVLPLLLSAPRVKLVPEELQVRLLLLFCLGTNPHFAVGMAHTFQFLIDNVGVSDVVHRDWIAIFAGSTFFGDDRDFSWGELTNFA